MRRVAGEVREIDLVHRPPIGATGDVNRAFDDVGHGAARLLDQRADVVERLLGLRAHVADRQAAVAVAADAADEHEPARDRRLGERQRAFVDAVGGDGALRHGIAMLA